MGKNLGISTLLDFYGEMLTDKQRSFVDYYYNSDLSLAEIAENEGITRQGVRDSIKRAEGQLFDMEDRLGLAGRFQILKTGIEKIKKAAIEISEVNKRYGYSREINSNAKSIYELAEGLGE